MFTHLAEEVQHTDKHTIALLQRPLQKEAGNIGRDDGRSLNVYHLPVGGHEAVDTELLHDLLFQKLHLGCFAVNQHHILGVCLRSTESGKKREKIFFFTNHDGMPEIWDSLDV